MVLAMLFLLSGVAQAVAQTKQDVLVMLNGDRKEGKVTAMKDDAVQFVYSGETLPYEFKKSEINKIEFASGRVETITAAAAQPVAVNNDRHGKIAVLPFQIITTESALGGEAMAGQLQFDCFKSIKDNTSGLALQDPMTTNSLLAKHGLDAQKIRTMAPKDVAIALGVEYVVYGMANITNKGSATYGSGYATTKGKENEKWQNNKSTTKTTKTTYGSSNSTTMLQYETKIDLSFYSDQGTTVYAEGRQSFGSGVDAYHATLNYLIKRCPFGSKAKH